MKTYKTIILVLSVFLLFSCSSNKTKVQDSKTAENTTITPKTESETNQSSPLSDAYIVQDEKQISLGDVRKSKMDISVADVSALEMTTSRSISSLRMESSPYDNLQDEEYSQFSENRFRLANEDPLSTFSVDVDAASYSNMRRFINRGSLPNKDAVRIEELINYFSYNYTEPTGNDPVKISTEVGNCPWNSQNRLVKIGLKARSMAGENLPASNFVFLIDVSGSMYGATRLDLVKSSLKLLTNNLREKDRVAIVVYAGSAGEVLPSTSGANKQKIKEALDNLNAGGSTAGGAGIQLAYKIAKQNFIKGGNNRIILCTDGDFNVGVSSNEGLLALIEQERKSGVRLWNGQLQR